MPTARIEGVELYWELTGGAGEPLVLVHGSWGDHHGWDRVVGGLAKHFRVLTYDRRGHSRSERPPGRGSVREDAADLIALVEHLGIGPAHIVGTSFGGAIVLRAAARRPDVFRSLLVHEPPLFGLLADDPGTQIALDAVRARIEAVAERLRAGEMEAGARQFVETIAFGPGAWDELPSDLRRTFVFNAPTWLDEIQDPESLTLDPGALSAFTAPALLSHGDASPPFFPLVLARLARDLPRAERRTFPGAGHVPHLTHPAEYIDAVQTFARRQP